MKLKAKLVFGNTLLVFLALGVLSLSQWLVSKHYAEEMVTKSSANLSERFVEHALGQAEQTTSYLTEALINPMYFFDLEGVQSLLKPALKNPLIQKIQVFDNQGKIFQTGGQSIDHYGQALEMPDVEKYTLELRQRYIQQNETNLLIANPLIFNNELLGGLVIQYSLETVYVDIERNKSIILGINELSQQSNASFIVIIAIIMCLVSLVFALMLANTLIKPISALVQHSERISKGQYLQLNSISRSDELGELALAFNEMDTNLKERTDAIEFLAYNDHLTQLPNRTQFIRCLQRLINSKKSEKDAFAILFIDLDEFKKINDNFGHQAGDELLCEVATIINRQVNKSIASTSYDELENSIVARIGGDEFLLCLPHIRNFDAASQLAKQLLTDLNSSIFLPSPNESVIIGASIGIAMYPFAGATPEDLVKRADIAMYEAKASGRGTHCHFTWEMEQVVSSRSEIERDLRLAVTNFSEFEVWYQPQVDLRTQEIIGVEALLRWHHPTKGSISPDKFIPIAEVTGIILPLGDWIIDQVCRDIAAWQDVSLTDSFHVAINLSAKQLYGQTLPELIARKLSQYGLPSHRLHMEVTETALMKDKQCAKQALDSLREMGIQVWLDDFGTGYSSLGYLREFNIDGLKIDRCFVADIENETNDRALCAAIISMAHALGVKVVAEGVETITQSNYLNDHQCNFGQGYLFAKPMPVHQLTDRILAKV
ncbi:EAL domain-containing protein [Vibrio sp. 404]|uniref:cyclic-guanylate-specific phosphodiesterase n=1 Tax=Vibrio marinisediminis TaxID=2758441 RepID=A0A7W2FQQ3_9VIBR|nr:EAL domain-containing protein [Vibrio marinisediminis]MBA5762524.1 EAL domain-containing protein [Vibrio marinisediminis]